MEFLRYLGWTIRTQVASRGIRAVITDPGDNTHQSIMSWQSHSAAMRYAQKFIDWHRELEAQPPLDQEPTSVRTPL